MGEFSIWHGLIALVIIMLIFGTSKLRDAGEDLGAAVRGFKQGMREGTAAQEPKLAGFIAEMRRHLAADVQTDEAQVNIKATTTEAWVSAAGKVSRSLRLYF